MSTINQVLQLLENSEKPVLRPLHGNSGFHCFIIAMKEGMILKEHKAKWPSKLTVIRGTVSYSEGPISQTLTTFEEKEIQVDILHALKAKVDSICILTQSKPDQEAIEVDADPRKKTVE